MMKNEYKFYLPVIGQGFSESSPSRASGSLSNFRISFRTKYPFSWGARKKVCVNFLLSASFRVNKPVTKTIKPPS